MTSETEVDAAGPEPTIAAARVSVATVVASALGIGAVLAVLADILFGRWDHDSGFFLQRGAEVASGLRPYLDFGSIYPPLMEVITAAMLATGLPRLLLAVLIPFGWVLANCALSGFLVYLLTRDHRLALVIGASFGLFSVENGGTHLTLEHGVTLFALLAFAALCTASPLTSRRLFVAGVFAACSLLIKQNGLLTFMVLGALLVDRRRELTLRSLFATVAGALVPGLATLAWLDWNVAAVYVNLVSKLGRYAAASETSYFTLAREFQRSPSTVAILTLALLAAVLAATRLPRYRFTAVAAACSLVLQVLPRYMRDYSHYNINAWAFAVLALCLGVVALEPRVRRMAALAVGFVCGVGLLTTVLDGRWERLSALFTVFHPAARAVYAVTPPDVLVRQYGSEPIIEFLAYRHQEAINKPESTLARWDGSGMYTTPPDERATVLVLFPDRKWAGDVARSLERRGFALVAAVPPGSNPPPVLVYKHRNELRRMLDAHPAEPRP